MNQLPIRPANKNFTHSCLTFADFYAGNCIYQMRSSGIRAISIQKPFPTFAVIVSSGAAMIPVYSKERRHLSILETKRLIFLFLAPLLLNNFLTLSVRQ
jgi:DNA (cytosine-5)-methyltransferase 1